MAKVRVGALAFVLGMLLSANSVAEADRSVADELATLKDPKQRGMHAGAVLALGDATDPGPEAQAALIEAITSADPVLVACAAHALERVGKPSVEAFDALAVALAYPVTLRTPKPDASGRDLVIDRAFAYTVLRRGGDGFTSWIVFRTWGAKTVAQNLYVAVHRRDRPPRGRWRATTDLVRIEKDDPVTLEVVGSSPAAGWLLKDGALERVPQNRHSFRAREPGALRDVVVAAATSALAAFLRKGDEALVRRALTHEIPAVRDVAIAVLMRDREPGPFAAELFEILVGDTRPRRVDRVFKRAGAAAGPVLDAAIRSDDDSRRRIAVDWVGQMGVHGKAAIPAIADLLEKGGLVPESALFRAISGVGREAGAATEALRTFVREHRMHYEIALDTLRAIGPPAKAAVPELLVIARTRPGFGHGRLRATMALASIDPNHPDLPDFVAKCLSDPNDNVIELALLNLSGWLKPTPEVLVALRNATKHKNKHIRDAAHRALQQFGK